LVHKYGCEGGTLNAWLEEQLPSRRVGSLRLPACLSWPTWEPTDDEAVVVSLLAYIEEVWGRNALSLFVAGLGHYSGWDEMVPALFGVPLPEFERRWRAWATDK
jgi:hypothetical protein